MTKYDDASWHYGADDFPKDLPPEYGGTHIGMFFAWIILNDLSSDEHTADFEEDIAALKARQITPVQHFMSALDGQLLDQDLNPRGNRFAASYFTIDHDTFISDYVEVLTDDKTELYRVEDSWQNYDRLAPRISQRFEVWLQGDQQ